MTAQSDFAFLSGGGLAGEITRSIDWSQTPLGPVETWPISLRTIVGVLLHSRQPMFLGWGPELIQFYNDGYLPMLGAGNQAIVIGGRGRDGPPEVWAILGPRIDAVMSRGETVWQEDALIPITRYGKTEDAYWTYSGSPVFDEAGGIGGVLIVGTETTARVLAARREQAALARAESEHSRVLARFEVAPAGICILRGPELVFEFANVAYCQLAGRSELIGKPLLELFPELAAQRIDDRLREVMRTREPFVSDGVRAVREATVPSLVGRFFSHVWTPMRELNGAIDSVAVFVFEVTEQVVATRAAEDLAVQLERALVGEHAARQTAEAANRAKDSFLATISHELRTPLTSMLGWTRMLIDGKISPAKREHALAVIERNAVAQTHLVDDLLDVSRIVAGNMRVQLAEVAFVPLIEAAIDTVRPALEAKGLELRASLGAVTSPVLGDAIRLQQVIWNLLVNAVKFTPRGGLIRVTLTGDDSRIEIRVDDNGRGISADFLPKVFDRFEQAATGSNESQSGLGLGLAISRHLVELHGGQLEAHSEGEGRGASFVLTLPVAAVREASALEGSIRRSEPRPGDAGDLEGLRVLVVDDEESARDRISSLLSEHGAVAIAVQNVADALAALVQYRPDVVVSDIGLPGEDGYSFIRRARSLSPASGSETPAAALTSHASEEDRARALVAGFQAHISKSVPPAQIVATVAELARLARKLR